MGLHDVAFFRELLQVADERPVNNDLLTPLAGAKKLLVRNLQNVTPRLPDRATVRGVTQNGDSLPRRSRNQEVRRGATLPASRRQTRRRLRDFHFQATATSRASSNNSHFNSRRENRSTPSSYELTPHELGKGYVLPPPSVVSSSSHVVALVGLDILAAGVARS